MDNSDYIKKEPRLQRTSTKILKPKSRYPIQYSFQNKSSSMPNRAVSDRENFKKDLMERYSSSAGRDLFFNDVDLRIVRLNDSLNRIKRAEFYRRKNSSTNVERTPSIILKNEKTLIYD